MMTGNIWIFLFVLISSFKFKAILTLKNVKLTIEPNLVQYGNDSTLRCTYELKNGSVLYSVKWYRGLREFYRYTPSESPSTKVFPFEGITIDENCSNSTQVVLRKIGFNLAGNFSCEVTTDLPHMATGVDHQSLMVIQLPEFSPKIHVGRETLDVGDTLRANCSSPPSRPTVTLSFKLNNITVADNHNTTNQSKIMEKSWSDLSLDLKLRDIHFDEGRLILRCIAQLPKIYYEYYDEVELELDSAKDPIPQRVRGLNGVMKTTEQTKLLYLLLYYFFCKSAIIVVGTL